jgi:hypothetical protein
MRAVYNGQTGEILGVVFRRSLTDRGFQHALCFDVIRNWEWHPGLGTWTYVESNGQLTAFTPN